MIFFQPIRHGVVLLVFGLMSLGPGTQSLGLGIEHLTTSVPVHHTLSTWGWHNYNLILMPLVGPVRIPKLIINPL